MSGKIHRVKTADNFVVLQKNVLKDTRLSWKAKGLHCYLMQLPSDWSINVSDLTNRSTDGRDSTAGALNELIQFGYAHRTKITVKGKFAGYDYTIKETGIKDDVNGKTVNGKTVNGKTVNGKTVNGKTVTTKKEVNEELSLLSNNIESSAPANFSKNETDSNFQKIGAIEINENPVPLKTGKMEQDAPGAGLINPEMYSPEYVDALKNKNGRTEGELEIDAAIDAYFDNVIISEQRRIAESKAIRPDDPNPVETATQIAVRFMQTNPDTVKLWCENARWSGTPQALVNEFREFFSYYQSTSPEHQSITRPEYWFKTRFPGWISKAKNFKNGTTNTNASPEQLANDSLRRALEYAEQERRRSGEARY